MRSKQPFARRIVIAFVLMTVVVSGSFSLSIVGLVHFIEQRLVSQEMQRELKTILEQDIRLGQPPRLDSKTQFYASNMPERAIPVRYVGLAEGYSELFNGDSPFSPMCNT